MNPKLKFILRIAAVIFAILFLIQPYNWFCQLTSKCNTFHLSYYIPKKEGTREFVVGFEAENYDREVNFFAEPRKVRTVSGRKHTVIYKIQNNSRKYRKIRPKMSIHPKKYEKYFIRHECLCFKSYTIVAGGSLDLKLEFEIDNDIEADKELEQRIEEHDFTVRFSI